jgi:hypothetical protein
VAALPLGLLEVGRTWSSLPSSQRVRSGRFIAQQGMSCSWARPRLPGGAVADTVEQGRGRYLVAQMLGQERDHLAADLQVGT